MIGINQIPNMISAFRILVSCSLLMFKNNPVLFFAAYIICGISDVLDGYIARRYNWDSKIGAKLDSISDVVFYAVVLYLLFFTTNVASQTWLVIEVIVIFVIRVANFLITKIKFREWGMLHSWANKITGLLLFLYIPFALVNGSVSIFSGTILFAITFASAVEEMLILLSAKKYDVNTKSYFI